MSDNRKMILIQLSDGQTHTGTAIASNLQITRAGVWKHIKALQADGVMIESDAGRGYCIPGGLQLLDYQAIHSGLESDVAAAVNIKLLDRIASTNDWLLNKLSAGLESGEVCLVERQTAGRGTRGRQWISPYGSNLYISLYWHFPCAPVELGGLSLAMAVVIADALHDAGAQDIKIKWPNDLYTSKGKLGGILIDMSAEVAGPSHVIIGVGLNLDMPQDNHSLIDQAVADLRESGLPASIDRNQLAALIIAAMVKGCQRFSHAGFAAFQEGWLAHDMVIGRQIKLIRGKDVIVGKACGVNNMGALELQTDSGRQTFSSGEVTLRLQS